MFTYLISTLALVVSGISLWQSWQRNKKTSKSNQPFVVMENILYERLAAGDECLAKIKNVGGTAALRVTISTDQSNPDMALLNSYESHSCNLASREIVEVSVNAENLKSQVKTESGAKLNLFRFEDEEKLQQGNLYITFYDRLGDKFITTVKVCQNKNGFENEHQTLLKVMDNKSELIR